VNYTNFKFSIRFLSHGLLVIFLLLGAGCAVHRGTIHEIEEGQTLWRISQVYGVELNTLLEVNGIEDPASVRAGTDIIIPGADRVREVPSTPQRTARQADDSRPSPDLDENESRGSNSSSSSNSGGLNQESNTSSSAPSSESSAASKSNDEAPTRYFDPVWPCDGRLASRFKKDEGPAERGIRIHTSEGSVAKAAEEGNIKLAGSWDKMPELGKIVIIFHSHDFTTVYAHLKSLSVSEGETVSRGQPIGTVGQTGAVDRSVCYFEVRYELEPRDPLIFLGEST